MTGHHVPSDLGENARQTSVEGSALADLLARVTAAEGPDRELDRAITYAFGAPGRNGVPTCAGFVGIGPFTASLDAALALCERVLPGWFVGLQQNRHHNKPTDWSAYVERSIKNEHEATAKTPALALLAAMLRAFIAQAAAASPDKIEPGRDSE